MESQRFRILVDIRGYLYASGLDALRGLVKSAQPTLDVSTIDRPTAIRIIEDKLELSDKDEDGGIETLDRVYAYLCKVEIKDTVKSNVSSTGWKKDLKISGTIGDPKTGLGFLSLVRQIEAAQRKGYSEKDIVEAVVKAVQAGSHLRSYLEGRDDLTLGVVKGLLRSHYKEKNVTELYHELSNMVQSPKEDPTEFLMRALDLRQKVMFASGEKMSGLSYTPTLVHGMFKHAFYTGLKDEVLRHEIAPSLEQDASDETLVQTLTSIHSREQERRSKLDRQGGNRPVKVNQVENQVEEVETKPKVVKEGVFITELREMRAQIEEIQNRLDRTNVSDRGPVKQPSQQLSPFRNPGCKACQELGSADTCRHCWRCGSGEHFKRGCRAKTSEN
jgi:hypothetical protein